MIDKFKVSRASKISSSPRTFNLAPGLKYSCLGATKACKDCYAMKGRFVFKAVKKVAKQNYQLVKSLSNKNDFNKLVKCLYNMIPKSATIFRLHSSGDWISQQYLDAWTEVMRRKPNVKFWVYTRRTDLNFQRIVRLANFKLFISADDYNMKTAKEFKRRYSKSNVSLAYSPFEHGKRKPAGSFVCGATSGKLNIKGACEQCKLCLTTNKDVVFLKH